jgi:hypothetical protein
VNDDVDLAPHRFTGLVAPAMDRIVGAGLAAGRVAEVELGQRYGGPAAAGFLVEFRARLAAPGGAVSGAGFSAVTRYRDGATCQRMLDKQVAHGMIHRRMDGSFSATERGAAYLAEVYRLHAEVTGQLWAGHGERVGQLVETCGRVLTAALVAGEEDEAGPGPAFTTMAPPHEPDGTPAEVLLLNRLDALRHHRADAHADAWTAAGHTPRSIVTRAPGPERLAIELETDRRAAVPYAVLAPAERLAMLADLAALPG